jgi:hypothetical protein
MSPLRIHYLDKKNLKKERKIRGENGEPDARKAAARTNIEL